MATQVEQHGCIVCGKLHTVKVTYGPNNTISDCQVTSLDGHCFTESGKPIVACNSHSKSEIEAAFAKHAPGKKDEEEEEAERGL